MQLVRTFLVHYQFHSSLSVIFTLNPSWQSFAVPAAAVPWVPGAGVCEEGRDRSAAGKLCLKTIDIIWNEGWVLTYGNMRILKRNGLEVSPEHARQRGPCCLVRVHAPSCAVGQRCWPGSDGSGIVKAFVSFSRLIYRQFIKALCLWLTYDCAVRREGEMTVAKNSGTRGGSWDPSNKWGSVWKGLDLLVWRESWNSTLQSKILDTAPNWSFLV